LERVEVVIPQPQEKKGLGIERRHSARRPTSVASPKLEDFKASLIKEQRKLHTRFLVIFIILACIALGILLLVKQ